METVHDRNTMSQVGDVLNRLYAAEATSVMRHLANAHPVGGAAAAKLIRDLKRMSAEALARMESLDAALDEVGETRNAAGVPIVFSSYHDVSASYLLPQLIAAKREIAALYEAAGKELASATAAASSAAIDALVNAGARTHRADLDLLESYRPAKAG